MIRTKQIGGDDGHVVFEIDYDDTSLLLLAVRGVNASLYPARGVARQVSNGRTYSGTFAANGMTQFDIPTGQAQRLTLTILPNGKLDGVEYYFMWPA